jgi:hypothetical protein
MYDHEPMEGEFRVVALPFAQGHDAGSDDSSDKEDEVLDEQERERRLVVLRQFLAALHTPGAQPKPLVKLDRRYSGDGVMLLEYAVFDARDAGMRECVLYRCMEKLSDDASADFIRLLLSDLPNVSRTQGELGETLRHEAAQAGAPVEVLSLLVKHNPEAMMVADEVGVLPLHEACVCLYPSTRENQAENIRLRHDSK